MSQSHGINVGHALFIKKNNNKKKIQIKNVGHKVLRSNKEVESLCILTNVNDISTF